MKKKLPLDRYPFIVRPLSKEEGGGYLVEYPDFPGVISDGESPEEAIRNGQDALAAALKALEEFGDAIPKPGQNTSASGQWRQRVPRSLHARLVARAQQEGVSLNTLVTTLIAEGLGRKEISRRHR